MRRTLRFFALFADGDAIVHFRARTWSTWATRFSGTASPSSIGPQAARSLG